jgi:probable F420-dependent oxidoreductase
VRDSELGGQLKEYGIMCPSDMMTQSQLIAYAQAAEGAGLHTIWVPELYGRDPFVTCALLLGATRRIRVGTAIANVYVRDARATKAAAYTLVDSYGDRFDLGLGLSNKVGNVPRGHEWLAPLTKMNDFVDRYDAAELMFPHEGAQVSRYLAAHGPKLMTLAGARLDGAFTYLQTLAYSAEAKDRLAGKKLLLMQPSVFMQQPDQARDIARKAIAIYMPLENYHRAWRERGFADADFKQGGSDPFIDALIAWGSVASIRERYQQQQSQGVDHIIIIPIKLDMHLAASWNQLEQLVRD